MSKQIINVCMLLASNPSQFSDCFSFSLCQISEKSFLSTRYQVVSLYFPHHYYTFDSVDCLTPSSIVPPTLTYTHSQNTHTHILMSSFLVLMIGHQLVLIQTHLLTLTFPRYTWFQLFLLLNSNLSPFSPKTVKNGKVRQEFVVGKSFSL